MKKIPLLFLIFIIIFMAFTVLSIIYSPTNSSTHQGETTTACIITIDNQKYDVTQFQSQHPGGNIFNCNTDMSLIFHHQHPQFFLNLMKSNLVN